MCYLDAIRCRHMSGDIRQCCIAAVFFHRIRSNPHINFGELRLCQALPGCLFVLVFQLLPLLELRLHCIFTCCRKNGRQRRKTRPKDRLSPAISNFVGVRCGRSMRTFSQTFFVFCPRRFSSSFFPLLLHATFEQHDAPASDVSTSSVGPDFFFFSPAHGLERQSETWCRNNAEEGHRTPGEPEPVVPEAPYSR